MAASIAQENITFRSPGFGDLRLAKRYVTENRLEELFGIEDAVVVDHEGNELRDISVLEPGSVYFVVSEKDLEQMSSDDEDNAHNTETMNELELKVHMEKQRELFRQRAIRVDKMNNARTKVIAELYTPKHPHLYTFSESFLESSFLDAIKSGDSNRIEKIFKKETETGIYSFRLFNMKFCRELIEEVENFENSGLPVVRPNSMNNYGVVLSDIGFNKFFDDLIPYVVPFSKLFFGDIGSKFDSHHPFIVQYKIGEDLDLGFHYDESEVTLNICLGKTFTGGSLFFRGLLEKPETHQENFEFNHVPGLGLVHLGKHRHGANKIKSGERYNLIVWLRNSDHRHVCTHCHGHHDHH